MFEVELMVMFFFESGEVNRGNRNVSNEGIRFRVFCC